MPLPLFQPSATLADVAAAAARAAEAEGGPVSGNGEQQQQRVEEAGLGGTSFGSAWAGGALDEVVAAAALEEEQQPNKRSRLVWTQELHNRFINALSHLVGAAGGGLPESQAQAERQPPGQGGSRCNVPCMQCLSARARAAPLTLSKMTPPLTSCVRSCSGVLQGLKNAVPKSILAMMNVVGMTRENVASHLQVGGWTLGLRW